MQYSIKMHKGTNGGSRWMKAICSCGWKGQLYTAYNDSQYAMAKKMALEEDLEHEHIIKPYTENITNPNNLVFDKVYGDGNPPWEICDGKN